MPFFSISSKMDSSLQAGPKVQMIFVFLIQILRMQCSFPEKRGFSSGYDSENSIPFFPYKVNRFSVTISLFFAKFFLLVFVTECGTFGGAFFGVVTMADFHRSCRTGAVIVIATVLGITADSRLRGRNGNTVGDRTVARITAAIGVLHLAPSVYMNGRQTAQAPGIMTAFLHRTG